MTIEAMKQALEYIKATNKSSSFWLVPASELNKTVNALTVAIAEAEKQENSGPINDGWQLSVSDGHSGRGVYAYMTEYPEEGAVFLMPIAEAEKQEPVAWVEQDAIDWLARDERGRDAYTNTALYKQKDKWAPVPLYTTPPAARRQWVGLTDEEIADEFYKFEAASAWYQFAHAIEAKLKEKNAAAQRQPLTEPMILALKRHEDGTSYTEGWNDALNVLADRAIEAAHGIGGKA